ncbi:MAG: secretin N-terminal domain-containing protein, partial [Nitrospirota bacterium]|nr:secretin N-terminal domain-containing protein [Nitrospirota bacterium]
MKKNIVSFYKLHHSPVLLFLVLSYILLLFSISVAPASAGTVKDEEVTFNFVDVELSTVTKFISEITGKNFIFDDRVKGNITIIAPSKLNVDDAYNLFTSILELKGFTVVPSGVDAYKIIPVAEAKQKGIKISYDGQPVNESYIARLVTLKNISSDDALRLIKPIVSMNGYVSDFGPGNMLLVIDSGLNIEKVLSIIDAIDQPSLREEPDIVFLRFSSADAVAKMINEGIGQSSARRGAPGKQSRMKKTKAVADQRLNAVILFGDKGMRESMKSLIAAIDVPSPDAQGMINVYTLENADATELAEVLSRIIKGARPQKKNKKGMAALSAFESAGGINI